MQQRGNDNLKRFHPIELLLDLKEGLLVKGKERNEPIIPKDLSQPQNICQGLLSELLHRSRTQMDKVKLMICVTMYNEPLEEMTKSIEGITASLEEFFEHGFLPHEIAVFVMFDGIEHVNNGKTNLNDDIVAYFSGHSDDKYEIPKEMTLKKQHKQYISSIENQKLFSQDKQRYYIAKRMVGRIYRQNITMLQQELKQKQVNGQNDQQRLDQQQNQQRLENQINESKKEKISLGEKLSCMKSLNDKAKIHIKEKENSALVYQDKYDFKYSKVNNVTDYMPIFYVFKYENGQKLSSHMWFFKGFCSLLDPDYCLLMDAGAIPKPGSICKLIFAMEQNPKIGGVCGTMRIDLAQKNAKGDQAYKDIFTKYLQRIFSIKRCQSCEYDIGHIFDKSFEASMNYIHVLPGAFSAYRYRAFSQKYEQGKQAQTERNILDIYLKQVLEKDHSYDTLEEANMFLAEDRVLCSLLYCNGYYLRYVRDAIVKVDPQVTLFRLLIQRKRWFNGSWFALNYVVSNFRKHLPDENLLSTQDKRLFELNLTFAKVSQLQQYFLLSFQTVWNYMILDVIFSPKNRIIIFKTDDEIYNSVMKQLFIAIYIFLVLMLIFLSLSYNPAIFDATPDEKLRAQQKREADVFFVSKFYGVSTLLGLMSLFTVGFTIYLFYTEIIQQGKLFDFYDYPYIPQNYLFLFVIISIFFQSLPYIVWLFVEFRMVVSILFSLIHYFFYLPAYTHLFQIFSFCRIDDLSWGTKGLSTNKTFNSETEQTYQKFYFLCKWIFLNSLVTTIIFVLFYLQVNLLFSIIILSFTVIFTLITIMKSIGAIAYQFFYRCYIKDTPASTQINISKAVRRAQQHMRLIDQAYIQ